MTRPTGHYGRNKSSLGLRARMAMVLMAAMLVLASCGDDSGDVEEDRQFANEPVATREETATIAVTPTEESATPVSAEPEVTASPETLLHSRGTPATLYTLVDGELLSISLGADPRLIDLPDGSKVVDFAGSPAGDRVAVLRADQRGSVILAFYSSDGDQLGDDIAIPDDASATPVADESSLPDLSVSWSPQGVGVLVLAGDSLLRVEVEGEPEPIDLGDVEGNVIQAALSPQGMRVLFQVVTADGLHEVYLRDVSEGRTREVTAVSAHEGYGITNVQWLPDGSGVLFVRGKLTHGVTMRGQVYVYVLGQEVPRLVATSGQGGPAATITDAVVSPDGRKVTYVISLLDGSRWMFHSLWVRSLEGNLSYPIPAGASGVVVNPRWFDGGIVWEQRPEQDAPGEFVLARIDQEPVVLVEEQGPPQATPGASPVTDDGATPVGSPQVTPGATPHH